MLESHTERGNHPCVVCSRFKGEIVKVIWWSAKWWWVRWVMSSHSQYQWKLKNHVNADLPRPLKAISEEFDDKECSRKLSMLGCKEPDHHNRCYTNTLQEVDSHQKKLLSKASLTWRISSAGRVLKDWSFVWDRSSLQGNYWLVAPTWWSRI